MGVGSLFSSPSSNWGSPQTRLSPQHLPIPGWDKCQAGWKGKDQRGTLESQKLLEFPMRLMFGGAGGAPQLQPGRDLGSCAAPRNWGGAATCLEHTPRSHSSSSRSSRSSSAGPKPGVSPKKNSPKAGHPHHGMQLPSSTFPLCALDPPPATACTHTHTYPRPDPASKPWAGLDPVWGAQGPIGAAR